MSLLPSERKFYNASTKLTSVATTACVGDGGCPDRLRDRSVEPKHSSPISRSSKSRSPTDWKYFTKRAQATKTHQDINFQPLQIDLLLPTAELRDGLADEQHMSCGTATCQDQTYTCGPWRRFHRCTVFFGNRPPPCMATSLASSCSSLFASVRWRRFSSSLTSLQGLMASRRSIIHTM